MIKQGNTPVLLRTILENVDKLQLSWSLLVLFAPRDSQKRYLEAPLFPKCIPEDALLQYRGQPQKVVWWEGGRLRAVF